MLRPRSKRDDCNYTQRKRVERIDVQTRVLFTLSLARAMLVVVSREAVLNNSKVMTVMTVALAFSRNHNHAPISQPAAVRSHEAQVPIDDAHFLRFSFTG